MVPKSAETAALTGRRGTRGTAGAEADAKLTARIVTTGLWDAHVYSSAGPHTTRGNPVFVLLHGIGMSHRYYRRLQRDLAGHGEVHSFDLPGFGAAAKPERQISVAEYAAVIAGALV